ncbi:MAG: type IV secretion system DNA-binding domain-containing protein [Candidatus Taylorbacteria bacterium]|nr:type IV secretion system DNA-binding domain-containing protein [Candidatus Taylorbacteria bacterium]
MELFNFAPDAAKFKNPEEEIAFLREQIAKKEREIADKKEKGEKVEMPEAGLTREAVRQYKEIPSENILHKKMQMEQKEAEGIVLELTPENHDTIISELLGIMQEKGLRNALEVARKMNDPHIDDDFERFLVQYLKAGYPIEGLKEKDPIAKSLKMTLFEVLLPETGPEEKPKALKELLSSMEQFYAGMLSVYDGTKTSADYFTIEIAVANHSDEFIFYVAVPNTRQSLFEKHILSVFHNAKITEKKDDYNIFSEGGATVGAVAKLSKNPALPLKTYDEFELDPLNMLLSSFSKIDKDGEGASIQFVLRPSDDKYHSKYSDIVKKIKDGKKKSSELLNPDPAIIKFVDSAISGLFSLAGKSEKQKEEDEKKKQKEENKTMSPADQAVVEELEKKIKTPILEANIRLMASSRTEPEAEEIMAVIESSFNQFENAKRNSIEWQRVKAKKISDIAYDYSFRQFSEGNILPLSIHELTSVIHFPATVLKSAPELKTSKAAVAPAPLELPKAGVVLGKNKYRGIETPVFMTPEDRLRHFYVIGQTGTGKTTILKNMIAQDIKNGEGVCMIDPHGSDIQDILSVVPPERYEDVIYFDPSYTARPMALNMLEYDTRFPEQKTFVVNEMLSIFNKLFDMKVAGGPMFEQYFRNSVMLVLEDPESGNTLLDVSRVLANKAYREMKISKCKNPIVVQFWREVADKAGGEASLANIVPYITSKFDVFLSNDVMRPVVSQEKSSFNFRQIMDEKKILLVNLSKGRLGDINANLIGLIIVGKILMAALSRVDSIGKSLPPFYLYIDEFQNITTNSISTILSEARKYKLSLNIAHQFIAQLEEGIRDSVFGNVGSIAAFRVGASDAEYLEKQFSPVFTAKDLMNVENWNAYIKMLGNGIPLKPFNIETMAPPKGRPDIVDKLKELSYLKYGKERAGVEEEIMAKYKK